METGKLLQDLQQRSELLHKLELSGPDGRMDERKYKKLREVAGFCEVALRFARPLLKKRDRVSLVEFSCGKSYLGLVLALVLQEYEGKDVSLVGVDWNAELVDKCSTLADEVGIGDAEFVASRTLDFTTERELDMAVALHACDTATDEAIAQGIRLELPYILTVPCCQNQIRGQIKGGHALTPMTDYGPLRYRLANMLTDALRAQFLHGAGYVVELQEIGSPRLTPKNLCICARKSKRAAGRTGRDADYKALRDMFGVKPKIEKYCPGVVGTAEE
jgi:hypothetical protein